MDVTAWLHGLGLGQYERSFADNAIDGEVLLQLTADDLKELGVLALGHRRKLLDAIATLRAAPVAELTGERRQVTVLFADLAGYTALGRELDAEELHGLVDRFLSCADRVVEVHGGRVDKHIGDCVMAVFGAPVSHGNDAERAVRAALAIRDAMPRLSAEVGRELGVHVGVAGGQVVAGGTGGGGNRDYTVTGDSVNLASRLTDAAKAGEVLVSDAVRHALGERLAAEELAALQVKGFAEPVRAWRLHGLLAADAPAGRLPLVGRRSELARFDEVLAPCLAQGAGRAVHLRGEAGIGKSRLVEAFQTAASRAGFACHAGTILDFGAGRGPIRELLQGMLGPGNGSDTELNDGADALFLNDLLELPQPLALRQLHAAMDHASREQGRRRVLARVVERASARQPRLLVVEDVHWADKATLALLGVLAASVRGCAVVLLTTSRPDGDPLACAWWDTVGADRPLGIDLGPLEPAEARALAAPFLAANAAAAEQCVARAGGNPLFLEQLLRHAEEGLGAAVPGSVQSLVQARLDRLRTEDRAVLRAAAVLGQRVELATLAAVLGEPAPRVERLVELALLQRSDVGFQFGHALVRDAVYDGMLRSQQRELHRRAAAWYADRDPVLRAEHLDRGGDPGAVDAYLAAARRLFAEYRLETALRLVERGEALASQGMTGFELTRLRADILHDLGRMPPALAAYEAALAKAPDAAARCRALIGCAAVKRVTDALDGAFADLGRAEVAAGEAGLVAERARIHFLRGNLYFPRGDIEGCLREHRASLALAKDAGAAAEEAAALGGLGDAEYVRGRMVSAHEAFRGCVDLCTARGLGRIELANRPMLAFTGWLAGDTRGALAAAEAAIAAASRVGQLRAEMIARHAAYFCRHSLTDWAEAGEHAERALALARQLQARRFEAEALAFQAELQRVAGRAGEARTTAEEALAICRETGMAFLGPVILGILALATEAPGAVEAILAEADGLLAAGSVSHNHYLCRRDAIDVCLRLGAWDRATIQADALADYVRAEPSPWSDFVVTRGRALAAWGRGDRGQAMIEELDRLDAEGRRLGHLDALPAIATALAENRSGGG